ncbi:WW domain-binding protein 2 [Ixodes scapularis]
MSLNTAHAPGGVLIFNGEIILLYVDGVDLTFEGQDARGFAGTKKGRLYLTTHRMVFTNKNTKDALLSFSFPFFTVSNLELEQPIFGANFIKGKVKAEVNGNWTGQCTFKLKFMKGGAIEFGQAMIEAGKCASRFMTTDPPPYCAPTGPYTSPPPPAYMPPHNAQYGFNVPYNVFPDAPPVRRRQAAVLEMICAVSYSVCTELQRGRCTCRKTEVPSMHCDGSGVANTVFMSDMPPPYPGVNSPAQYPGAGGYPNPQSQPGAAPMGGQNPYNGAAPAPGFYAGVAPPGYPGGQQQPAMAPGYPAPAGYPSLADAKAAEAAQSAYYNPANPNFAYTPSAPPGAFYQAGDPAAPQGPPPPYAEHSKKNN